MLDCLYKCPNCPHDLANKALVTNSTLNSPDHVEKSHLYRKRFANNIYFFPGEP